MLRQWQQYFYVAALLCGLAFSQTTYGNMEITAYGGINFSKDLKLSEIADKVDQEARSIIFGGDIVYRLPISDKYGVGLRWQHNRIWGTPYRDAEGNETTQTLNFNANRIALLANCRFINSGDTGFFLGLLLALDVWRSLNIQTDATSSEATTSDSGFQITSQEWPGTGQLALELGFKWTPQFFIRGEVGYSYYAFNDLTCNRNCEINANNSKLDLKTAYATLGLGWFFM